MASSKLTTDQLGTLRLLDRSARDSEGWSNCAPALYEVLIFPMSDELIEKRNGSQGPQARLTDEALIVLKWL